MKDSTIDEIINLIIDMKERYGKLYTSLATLNIEKAEFYGIVEGLDLAHRIIRQVTGNDTETTVN